MKAIKLLLIALALIGAVVGLLYLTTTGNDSEEPDFTSAQANEWKDKINALCKDGEWNSSRYSEIESGIHSDRVTSKGELISMDEEKALNRYLYSSSCRFIFEGTDALFKQDSYSKDKIESYEAALDFMKEKVTDWGANSNLTEASNIFAAYHQVMRALSFSSHASYSRPLKKFPGGSADGAKNRIKSMKYYQSHFCHNDALATKVDNLDADRKRAEEQYYNNLELAIEENYKSTGRIENLLDDQIHFNEISTNKEAIQKLTSFVNNPNN